MAKDFYLVLQVRRTATLEEIRSAYRRRALELHPDKSGNDSEPFVELQEAYSVLSDPVRRAAQEHEFAAVPLRNQQSASSRQRFTEPLREVELTGAFREVSLSQSFDRFRPSFEEVFDRLWSNFDLLTRPKAEHVEALTVDVPLSSQEAWAGGGVSLLVPARITCPGCGGTGAIGSYECWKCRGQGALTAEYPVQVRYPAGLVRDLAVRMPLDGFGIQNFFLTVRFRPTVAA
jgi:DnaJ-class molecular chaperone